MITADVSNLETELEVKRVTSMITSLCLFFLSHFAQTSLGSLSQTFPYLPPRMECSFQYSGMSSVWV